VALRKTYRLIDGEQIEGTTRPIFIRNGDAYFLTDLRVFADGVIDCWGLVDLDGLREKLRTGWVATSLPPGARASAHHLASWRFSEPQMWVTAEQLLGEVADDIDTLNGRPDSTRRCHLALDRYLESRSEPDRIALRDAYQAIPRHLRVFALGDMDRKDGPLRVLCTETGSPIIGDPPIGGETIVTEQMREEAFGYFAGRERAIEENRQPAYPDGPEGAQAPTLTLSQAFFPKGWPADPGTLVLRNEYPAPITVDAVTYPTVAHAYWALAVTSPEARDRIRDATRPYDAEKLAGQLPLRPDWATVRLAVMAGLLRAKYTQHPGLADILLATGDARIHYTGVGSRYWNAGRREGRNWMGRLLELIRAEIASERAASERAASPAPVQRPAKKSR
jgi:predicted NAD-dependent protein-ADP-ribosyltransferase YbiA (DUF1768 family)